MRLSTLLQRYNVPLGFMPDFGPAGKSIEHLSEVFSHPMHATKFVRISRQTFRKPPFNLSVEESNILRSRGPRRTIPTIAEQLLLSKERRDSLGDWAHSDMRDRHSDDMLTTSLESAQAVVCQVRRLLLKEEAARSAASWQDVRHLYDKQEELFEEAKQIIFDQNIDFGSPGAQGFCGPVTIPLPIMPNDMPVEESLASSSLSSTSESGSEASSDSLLTCGEFRAFGSNHNRGGRGHLHLAAAVDETVPGIQMFSCACGRHLQKPDVLTSAREASVDPRTWSPRCARKVPKAFRAILGLDPSS